MKKKLKIAVLLDISRTYDRDLLQGITKYNKLHGKFNFFFHSPKYIHGENDVSLINRVIDWKPDGVLTREIEGLQSLIELNIPLIIVPYKKMFEGHINIWGNNRGMGEMAAKYFIEKGYKNYAFFGFKDYQWSVERQEGFEAIVNEEGFKVSHFIFDSANLLWEQVPPKLLAWLSSLQKPCAVFSANDEMNIHLLETAHEINAKIPDDLSVIGVDNDVMICEMVSPTLSSIDHNAIWAGYEAATALRNWMEFGTRPSGNIFADYASIINRNSTDALAIEDDQVRIALHYIANTAVAEDISVDDVVRATNLSRRILEMRFHSTVKSSILEEIKKVRIGRIKSLLENSKLSVQQIAFELNFKNVDNITRYFRQYTGLTPLEYRNKNRKA